ncbi:MAG: hypothetical protein ACUVX9_18570 [Anaerolineae bacterium]
MPNLTDSALRWARLRLWAPLCVAYRRPAAVWAYGRGQVRTGTVTAVQSLLTHRYLPLLIAALAATLAIPTLWAGWGCEDDVLHRSLLLSSSLPVSLSRLFVFLDPQTNPALMDLGTLPWWTYAPVRVAFFRPLAALTHWLDSRLWPASPLLMHAQSALWYVGACAAAAALYQRLMGRRLAAGLAALILAASMAHASLLNAVSSRNVVQALLFGCLTLVLHDRWRRAGRPAFALLGMLTLALALLSAEGSIATCAYLAAYALCLDRNSWQSRLASLLPYVAIVACWRLVYQRLGYGAWASGFYIDPAREPARYLGELLAQGPVLLLGQWLLPDVGAYALLSTALRYGTWLFALAFLPFMGALLVPLWQKSRQARFWGLGMALSVLPVCAVTFSSGRHMVWVGAGAAGLMAIWIVSVLESSLALSVPQFNRLAGRVLGIVLLVLHLLLFPVLRYGTVLLTEPTSTAMADLGPIPATSSTTVVIINAPSPGQLMYIPSQRQLRGEPMPRYLRALAPAHTSLDVTRLDARTLEVRPRHGYQLPPGALVGGLADLWPLAHASYACQYGDLFVRSDAHPLQLGEQVDLSGMSARVTQLTGDGRPLQVRVTFALPLEDPSLYWLRWDWRLQRYVPCRPPRIGETLHIAGGR